MPVGSIFIGLLYFVSFLFFGFSLLLDAFKIEAIFGEFKASMIN